VKTYAMAEASPSLLA